MTLIAEDVLLLLLDDESGKPTARSDLGTVLGGALLVELALDGAVTVTAPPRRWTAARVTTTAGAALPADPMLRDALGVAGEKQWRAEDLVRRLGRRRREELLDRLVERGLVHREQDRVLGLFARTRWPAADSRHEQQVREQLRAALVDGAEPDPRTGAIVAVLRAADQVHKVITAPGRSAREIKRRADEIAEGSWAADSVRDALQAANSAMIAAVTAAAVASS